MVRFVFKAEALLTFPRQHKSWRLLNVDGRLDRPARVCMHGFLMWLGFSNLWGGLANADFRS
jgi:hypothetical protein